jgi:hypothetical protein
MTTTTALDVAALTAAIETNDAPAQLQHYLPDATIDIVDQNNPPSRPKRLAGTDAIRDHIVDVVEQQMTHQVRTALSSGDRIAFEVACSYPDGTRVLCLCVAGVVGGRIAWQRTVQAWDA